jgi:hypothetical protein
MKLDFKLMDEPLPVAAALFEESDFELMRTASVFTIEGEACDKQLPRATAWPPRSSICVAPRASAWASRLSIVPSDCASSK